MMPKSQWKTTFQTYLFSGAVSGIATSTSMIVYMLILERELSSRSLVSLFITGACLIVIARFRPPWAKAVVLRGLEDSPLMYYLLVTLILWAPALVIIYWMVNPANWRKAIEICVFLAGVILGVCYYIRHRKELPSISDKVTYFSGVCTVPVVIVKLLL
jgi:hypothetical protein